MKSTHQLRVEAFMRKAGQDVPERPVVPSQEVRRLRASLILEEALETIEGLGFRVQGLVPPGIPTDGGWVSFDDIHWLRVESTDYYRPSLIEIADGCADIIVVTTGTLSACGIHDLHLQESIDLSNLRKFGPGGRRRSDGKWIKPPDWVAPDIDGILRNQLVDERTLSE